MALTETNSGGIKDGTIVNADVNASAAIAVSKISGAMPTAGGTFTGDVTWDNGTNAGKDMIWDESDDTLKFNDDVQISLGSDRDVRLYHTGSHAYVNVVTGDLNIRTNSTESAIVCTANAGVATYYDAAKKTETTATGLEIVGGITTTTASTFVGDVTFDNGTNAGKDLTWDESDSALKFADNVLAYYGSDNDLVMYHTDSHGYIKNTTGTLYIQDDTNIIIGSVTDTEAGLKYIKDGAVELYYDNVKKAETVSGGFTITGTCTATAFAGDGSALTGVTAVPAGAVVAWCTGSAPTGWLICNGSAVSRSTYSGLFGVISDDYGAGDGSSTFNLPDYRGEFLRGTDGGINRDPDRASRTDRGDGTGGDVVGSKQGHEFASHNHSNGDSGGSGGASPGSYGVAFGNWFTGSRGGNETRPRNVNVSWIIKT
jgi:hypothetical protein